MPNTLIPLPPNPLLPMVQEMAERIVRLERRTTGKLWARCSTEGPQSIDELRVLLGRNGMWAAAWLIEREADVYEDANADADAAEEEIDELKEKLEDAEATVAALESKLQFIARLINKPTEEGVPDDEPESESGNGATRAE